MKHQVLLPRLQVSAICPYPEPYQSTPCAPSNCLKIHLNIILQYTPGSSKWFHSLSFPHQNSLCISPRSHTCYMPNPTYSYRIDHPNNVWWAVQNIKPIPMAARYKASDCGRSPAEIVGSNLTGGVELWVYCCECCVLSGRGLCDELIIRPEETYRLWYVVVRVI